MSLGSELRSEDAPIENIVQSARLTKPEGWWYRQGALLFTAVVASLVWFLVINPKVATPKTEMVAPAAVALESGLKQTAEPTALSQELHFKVSVPDLRQLGAKLTKSGTADFGGQPAAVLHFQYGKSDLLLYEFSHPSKQFADMKRVQDGKNWFYSSSDGAVAVVAWKDKSSGYYALAAKSTEKDLVALVGKMLRYL